MHGHERRERCRRVRKQHRRSSRLDQSGCASQLRQRRSRWAGDAGDRAMSHQHRCLGQQRRWVRGGAAWRVEHGAGLIERADPDQRGDGERRSAGDPAVQLRASGQQPTVGHDGAHN
jgi:hypothetical protein